MRHSSISLLLVALAAYPLATLCAGCSVNIADPPSFSGPDAAIPGFLGSGTLATDAGFGGRTLGSLLDGTVQATTPPPPISGGTLLLTQDGTQAVVSDPERDQIDLVEMSGHQLQAVLPLQAGDEPGRAVQDNGQQVHVVLRGGGAVATVNLSLHTVTARTAVCPLPRGIAYNPANDSVIVACAGGELVTLPAAGGAPTQTLHLTQLDLRDVLVVNGVTYVTRFREAQLLTVAADGTVSAVLTPAPQAPALPPSLPGDDTTRTPISNVPTVAWRAVAMPDHTIAILHQYAQGAPVEESPGGYTTGASCGGGVVTAAISVVDPTTTPTVAGPTLGGVVLGVDMAVSPDGSQIAVASAGSLPVTGVPEVWSIPSWGTTGIASGCAFGMPYTTQGQAVAVAFTPAGELVAQTREPSMLVWVATGAAVRLAPDSRADTGHTIFHANAGGGLACASCHPEGTDDGHIWNFDPVGPRRTQSLRGSLLSRMPFHWDGDLADMPSLVSTVFTTRMSGGALSPDQVTALGNWLNGLPALPAPTPSSSQQALVAQGQQLFNDPTVGCSGCHSGSLYTNNTLNNVGTGGTFKVPSLLGVSWRAPYMHNGCATTLMERFTPSCGGGDLHGHTSQLAMTDLDALVAYLGTL